jgi:hypothetical protein
MIPLIANPWRRTCFSGRAKIQGAVVAEGIGSRNLGAKDDSLLWITGSESWFKVGWADLCSIGGERFFDL